MDEYFTLEDLVSQSGLPLRTVRYYIQEGLLPGPDTYGKNARYSQKHLERLELIQKLKMMHLPLNEIRSILNNLTSKEVTEVLEKRALIQESLPEMIPLLKEDQPAATPGSSALAYIHAIEENQSHFSSKMSSQPSASPFKNQQAPAAPAKHLNSSLTTNLNKKENWQRVILQEVSNSTTAKRSQGKKRLRSIN
jgi:DNA-binding transcriptional MerR regulator